MTDYSGTRESSSSRKILAIGGHTDLDGLQHDPYLINQIMVKSIPAPLSDRLREHLDGTGKRLVFHAPYTINLAHSCTESGGRKSIEVFLDQIAMTERLVPASSRSRDPMIVFHVGKSGGGSKSSARQCFYRNLETVLSSCPKHIQILLETPAGQGTEMFVDPDELLDVYRHFQRYSNFGLCLDTCHYHSAGNSLAQLLESELQSSVSMATTVSPFRLIHLNDSATPFGSRVDRHANIGTGSIFTPKSTILDTTLTWAERRAIPIILETDPKLHHEEIRTLYRILYPDVRYEEIERERSLSFSKVLSQTQGHKREQRRERAIDDDYIINDDFETGEIIGDEDEKEILDDIIGDSDVIGDGDEEIIGDNGIDEEGEVVVEEDGDEVASALQRMTTNDRIVYILTALSHSAEGFRKRAFLDAVEAIKAVPFEISSVSQVRGLKGVGKGNLARVSEIIETGTLEEFEAIREELEAVHQLTSVSGIGDKTAQKLYATHRIRTVGELVRAVEEGRVNLTRAQQSSLKYFWDIQQRVPREEIILFDKWIETMLDTIEGEGDGISGAEHLIVGSYRRGAKDSGDIDVLLRHPALKTQADVYGSDLLERLLTRMRSESGIDSILSQGRTKVMMIAHLPGATVSRRVDFLLTPMESYAAASLYFTGSKYFNLLTRNRAIARGYKLNEYGLYGRDGERVPVSTEADILSALGMEYIAPQDREESRLKRMRFN